MVSPLCANMRGAYVLSYSIVLRCSLRRGPGIAACAARPATPIWKQGYGARSRSYGGFCYILMTITDRTNPSSAVPTRKPRVLIAAYVKPAINQIPPAHLAGSGRLHQIPRQNKNPKPGTNRSVNRFRVPANLGTKAKLLNTGNIDTHKGQERAKVEQLCGPFVADQPASRSASGIRSPVR